VRVGRYRCAAMPGVGELLQQGRGRMLLFCWLGWVFDFADLILFAFVKGAVGRDLHLDVVSVAWIEGWSLLATAVGGWAFGRLADRRGRRGAMTLSILVYSAGALLTASAQGGASLLVARIVTGLGVGGEWGIGHAVVAEVWPVHQRDRVHGILQAGSPVAMAVAAAVGCFVAPHTGWRVCFLLAAGPALLAFMARWAMPGADLPPVSARMPLRELWAPGRCRVSVVLFFVLLLHMTGFWCVYAELPAALMRQLHVSPQQVGWFQIQVNAVQVFADVLFGWLAARFGRIRMFVLFCVVFAAGQLLVAARLGELQADFSHFTLAVTLMGIGAGTWSCFGALFGRCYPAALRATAAATIYSLSRGAQLFSKPLMGLLFVSTGSFAPALWVGAGAAIGSALLAFLLPRGAGAAAGEVEDEDLSVRS
jgi:MFS family permease